MSKSKIEKVQKVIEKTDAKNKQLDEKAVLFYTMLNDNNIDWKYFETFEDFQLFNFICEKYQQECILPVVNKKIEDLKSGAQSKAIFFSREEIIELRCIIDSYIRTNQNWKDGKFVSEVIKKIMPSEEVYKYGSVTVCQGLIGEVSNLPIEALYVVLKKLDKKELAEKLQGGKISLTEACEILSKETKGGKN